MKDLTWPSIHIGRSGLAVSPLALGTMTFGMARWGMDRQDAETVFDAYVDAGGNLVDTADVYAGGAARRCWAPSLPIAVCAIG